MQIVNMLKGRKIIVFGTGNAARIITGRLSLTVDYYIDNNQEKWQVKFLGRDVKKPDALLGEEKGSFFVLIASTYYEEISEQLINMGFEETLDFFNTLDWFINPLDLDCEYVVYDETKGIQKKIDKMICLGFYEDARNLLESYKDMFPFDGRISGMSMLIALKQGKYEELEKFILDDISNKQENYEMNLLYIQACGCLIKKNYVKALSICEKLIFECKDLCSTNTLNRVMKLISVIEKEHSDGVLLQLAVPPLENTSTVNNEDSMIVHLMLDHFICKRFFEALGQGKDKNIFIVFYDENQKRYFTGEEEGNILFVQITRPFEKTKLLNTVEYLKRAERVYIHYLHEIFCWILYKYEIDKNLNWILWGADLYCHIDMKLYDNNTEKLLAALNYDELLNNRNTEETGYKDIFRKSVIRKMSSILTWNSGDYVLVKQNFITAAAHEHFFYNNPVDFNLLDSTKECIEGKYNFHKDYKHVFMLGNSGDPTNNHMSLLLRLKELNRKDFCVVLPLGYGVRDYIDKLIEEGNRLLGKQFIPLLEFIKPEQYSQILSQVDIAFMNHKRQQGAGNIIALLYLGKKIYMNVDVTTYRTFCDMGIKLFDIDQLGKETFEDIIKLEQDYAASNRSIINKNFDPSIINKNFRRHFL